MMKKVLTIICLVTLVMGSSSVHAIVNPFVFDIPNTLQQTKETTVSIKQLSLKKLDRIALKISKKLLDKMTDSVVIWAAGGFKGDGPAFISNFKEYAVNSGIAAGTVLIDELETAGEKYATSKLTAAEALEQKKCVDNEKEYSKYYNIISQGLLVSGINLGYGATISLKQDGEKAFNDYLANHGGYPPYISNGKYNLNVLDEFIRNEIMDNKDTLVATGLNVDYDTLQTIRQKQHNCQKTLALKSAGLSYTKSLVKFVGDTYRAGRQGTANSFGVPNFDEFGDAYKKSLSDNWKAFQTDASRGGWAAWGEVAKLENTPWGAKYKIQAALSNQLAEDLGQKSAQLARNGGFLDKGECKTWKQFNHVDDSVQKVCVDYQANNPGSVIREAVNKRVLQQYDQLNNVDNWSDLLLTTGVKLVTGVLQDGVLPLANNAIDRGLSCLAGECQDDAFGQTNVASTQTITNSGNAVSLDDVVDIQSVLYGQTVLQKDINGDIVYERRDPDGNIVREKREKLGKFIEYVGYAGKTDAGSGVKKWDLLYKIKPVVVSPGATSATGQVTPDIIAYVATKPNGGAYTAFWPTGKSDSLEPEITINYTNPQYAYQTDNTLTDVLVFETGPSNNLLLDDNADKIPKLVRQHGSLELAQQLQKILTEQYNFVKGRGIRMQMDLDHVLPGPDLGWEERLTDKYPSDSIGGRQSAMREIYEIVKQKFRDGINGNLKDDPFDVVLVSDNYVPYTNPQYQFLDFKYPVSGPGTLNIQADGSPSIDQPSVNKLNYEQYIDRTFPKVLQLTRIDDNGQQVQGSYRVVSMNTHAGLWFNPIQKRVEAVGNIPDAEAMLSEIGAVTSQYADAIDMYKRRGTELKLVETKLKELKKRYESLPYITATSSVDLRVERTNKENAIAYEISLIRDRLPIYDEISEAQSSFRSILMSYDRMGEMIAGTAGYRNSADYDTRFGTLQVYRGDEEDTDVFKGASYYFKDDPTSADRYKDLVIKDNLGILYCGLQDHSLLNGDTKTNKSNFAKGIVNAIGNFANVATLGISPIAQGFNALFGGSNNGYYNTSGGQGDFKIYGGLLGIAQKKKWLESGTRMSDTLEYRVPYRCYETSVVCKKNDDPQCSSFAWECNNNGHDQDDDLLMGALPVGCKSVYKSSLNDYLRAIDPDYQ